MSTRPKTNRQRGAPSKKNEAIIKRLIAACKLGLPYGIAAMRAGISRETLAQWRSQDAELDRQLDEARAEAAEKAWRKIMAAGDSGLPNAWQSIAWRLERSHPESFARPEIQLHAHSQTNINNVLSITVEEAKEIERRSKPIRDEIDALLAARQAKLNSVGAEPSPPAERSVQGRVIDGEAQVISNEPIVLPPPEERAGGLWWKQLAQSIGTRSITREAFMFALSSVMIKLRGIQPAGEIEVNLGEDQLFVRDLRDTIDELSGSAGWEALLELGGSQV